jgi:transcriptional regulator with XRE-family HTH domain
MPSKRLYPETVPAVVEAAAKRLGRNLRTARLRRGIPQRELAARAGMSRPTLVRMEAGFAGTGLGAWLSVLWVLGLLDQMAEVAAPERDELGLTLEASRRGRRARRGSRLSDDF